ncbi:MAG: histidine kinase [Geobacteraceae bacterium GWC2_58_44]|nr:MAG: histidine kinase [Geobacteraceae bacterium GWC2_58_44]HBG08357.1 sensor histidine kinase [Geobacter sp.]
MKARRLFSIKTKFVLISACIVALFSLTWGGQMIREEKAHLSQNLEGQGRLLLTSLKGPIINTMILGEMGLVPGLLDNYVEEVVKNPSFPTVYAFITDENGRVVTHNRTEYCGKYYNDPLTRAALAGDGFQSAIAADGCGNVLDMALPLRIAGKSWGALRVGFSMTPAEEKFEAFRMRIVMFSVLLFLACTVILYVVGRAMSRPLEQLARAMAHIELGAFNAKPLPPRRDEIGLLQESFQHMLERLRHSERERENALNHLIQNEKMATIGKIVAGVAHEINNPLAAISACVYKVEEKLPPESGNLMDILKAGMLRIQTIVHQLTDFSRVGSLDLQYVPSDQFFREAAAFAVMAQKRPDGDLIALDQCQPPVMLHIDKGKMHQVLLNLLVNATAASPEAGSVELRATLCEGGYRLTVRDRGAGIPDQDRERIFDIFYTTKPAGAGSGIGLAVCKSIVDLHRGSIEVASRQGETVFSVTIPLHAGGDALPVARQCRRGIPL